MEDFDLEMIDDAQLDIVEDEQDEDPIMEYQDQAMDELVRETTV